MEGFGETLGRAPMGSWGSDGWRGPGLTASSGSAVCVCFLARDPLATEDYYNWGQSQKPSEDDDDTNSYENVLICKPPKIESGDEGSEDYQNSASIQQWRESKRVVEPVTREAPPSPGGSPDEEPDYVNGDVAATKA